MLLDIKKATLTPIGFFNRYRVCLTRLFRGGISCVGILDEKEKEKVKKKERREERKREKYYIESRGIF